MPRSLQFVLYHRIARVAVNVRENSDTRDYQMLLSCEIRGLVEGFAGGLFLLYITY